MPRKPTGTVEWKGDHWEARVTLADGSRPWLSLGPSIPRDDRERAKREAAALAARMRERGVTLSGVAAEKAAGETFKDWCERWLVVRARAGLSSERVDRGRLVHHVWPLLGATPIRAITRAQVEQLVERLDANVRAKTHVARTAEAIWSLVRMAFSDARGSKVRALRCREDNPTDDVHGPDPAPPRRKQYLFPSEVRAVLTDFHAPLRYRRLVAVAVYSYLRAGELKALEWPKVDLEHGLFTIDASEDAVTGKVGSPKNGEERVVPIEPRLIPLLRVMREEAGGRGRVFAGLPRRWWRTDKVLRRLRAAGVERAALFATTDTRKRLTFHDLRATGITWMAVRGDEHLRIKQRAGHKTFSTTERYIREADAVRAGFGEVFAPLPAVLLESSRESSGGGPHGGKPLRRLGQKQRAEVRAWRAREAARVTAADDRVSGGEPRANTHDEGGETMPKGAIHTAPNGSGTIRGTIPGPRGALLAALSAAVRDATASGDLECARIAHDALGRLLGAGGALAEGAEVVDLAAHREGRS